MVESLKSRVLLDLSLPHFIQHHAVRVPLLLALCFLFLGSPSARVESASEPYFERAEGALAIWAFIDTTGCVYTDIEVWGYHALTTSDYREVAVWVHQQDRCGPGGYITDLLNVRGYAPASALNVEISPSLSTAYVDFTLDVLDTISGSVLEATLHVTWMETGNLETGEMSHSMSREEGVLVVTNELPAQRRTATADGAVWVNGLEYTGGRISDRAELGRGAYAGVTVALP